MNYHRPALRDALASEYVLGTLHGRARRRFERLLRHDPELQKAVEFWQRELMPMARPLETNAPTPARLWAGIEARIAPAPPAVAKTSWVERWFGVRSLLPLAAGVVLGVGLSLTLPIDERSGRVDEPTGTQLPASYAGILSDANGKPAMLVSSRRHGRIVDVKVLRPIGLGQGQELTLWAIGPQGPTRLGAVPPEGKGRLELPATSEQLLASVSELAVAVSAKGVAEQVPTFILRGPCAKFW